MVNWKTFKTFGSEKYTETFMGRTSEWEKIEVDGWIEFKDGYEKYIKMGYLPRKLQKEYIEIDVDKTKLESKDSIFYSDDRFNRVWRSVPWELVEERKRDEMIRVSSADPTTLAITREGMDRVDRGNQTEFKQEVVDMKGNTHKYTYRKY